MSIRLAVFQRGSQPLEGLCAQLRCAGYDVFERYTGAAVFDLSADTEIDVLLIDAGAREAKRLLDGIKDCPRLGTVPVMLIVTDEAKAQACASWSPQVDDIIVLPIERNDLRARVRSLSRLVSMTAELIRRQAVLSDFGVDSPVEPVLRGAADRINVLIVGEAPGDQVELLEALGGTITASYAETSVLALAHLNRSPLDQVDMVIVMAATPAAEVRALFRLIRAAAEWADLPILLVEDAVSGRTLEAISPWGDAELLPKPHYPVVVCRRLQVLTRQWRLRRQLRGMMADSKHAPTMDGLTGLYGHGFLHHYISRSITESRRRALPLSLAACTVSGLSQINAVFGYPAGDQILRQLGAALAGSCRAQDLVARAGHAGFCIVLNDTSEHEAVIVCHRIADILARALQHLPEKQRRCVQAITGLAEMSGNDDAAILVRRAFQQRLPVTLNQAS